MIQYYKGKDLQEDDLAKIPVVTSSAYLQKMVSDTQIEKSKETR